MSWLNDQRVIKWMDDMKNAPKAKNLITLVAFTIVSV